MIKFCCHKLVRDNTLERMQRAGVKTEYKIIEGESLKKAMHEKLLEEAHEVTQTTNSKDLMLEIVDLLDVIQALCDFHGIKSADLETIAREVLEARGAFKKGIFLACIEMEADNPLVEYCRKNPEKYKEKK